MKVFSICALALLLCAPLRAAELQVHDLRLDPDSAWRRATPAQEAEDGALSLSLPADGDVGLQVLIPRDAPLVKTDAETFYRQLGRKWDARHGKAASVGWVAAGQGARARRWLACRRPAQGGEGVVFHLATVHAGRAYSLLLFAPPGTETLPGPARGLLARVGFRAADVTWRHARSLPLFPQGEALDGLAQVVAQGLGETGMLSGYGIKVTPADAAEPHLDWFLDGFRWSAGQGRDARASFEIRGGLTAVPPARLDGGRLRVTLSQQAAPLPLTARVSARAYCGDPEPWREALQALERGARSPLERLRRDHACAAGAGETELGSVEAGAGQTVTREFPVPLETAEGVTARWLEVGLSPVSGAIGESLLERLGLFFFYAPAR